MDGITTYDVSVWKIATARNRRRKHGVRWRTAGQEHSEWFATKALADSFRTDLIRAQRAGERFDVESGLPTSVLAKRSERSLLEVAESYVDHLWSVGAPPNTRRAAVMHLSAAVPLFVRQLDHRPPRAELQRLLSSRLLPPPTRTTALTTSENAAASWLRRASRPVGELVEADAVADLLAALGNTADGRRVASSTWDTRRSIVHREWMARCQSDHGPQAAVGWGSGCGRSACRGEPGAGQAAPCRGDVRDGATSVRSSRPWQAAPRLLLVPVLRRVAAVGGAGASAWRLRAPGEGLG